MMPPPPIHQPSDARHSGWLGQHSRRLPQVHKSARNDTANPCPATPAAIVAPHPHPSSEAKQLGRALSPTSPNLTPRLNPHRARGTDGAPTSRDFVPRRFSDAGLRACGRRRRCRRPKTCTGAEISSWARALISISEVCDGCLMVGSIPHSLWICGRDLGLQHLVLNTLIANASTDRGHNWSSVDLPELAMDSPVQLINHICSLLTIPYDLFKGISHSSYSNLHIC